MFSPSEKYAARVQLLAAEEAVLAADIWHGTGAIIVGLLLQSGAELKSVVIAALERLVIGKNASRLGPTPIVAPQQKPVEPDLN